MAKSINDYAIEYGKDLEGKLRELGASSEFGLGAGALLDQVKDQLHPDTLRAIRRFLKLRNMVVHTDQAVELKQLQQSASQALEFLNWEVAQLKMAKQAPKNAKAQSTGTSGDSHLRLLQTLEICLVILLLLTLQLPEKLSQAMAYQGLMGMSFLGKVLSYTSTRSARLPLYLFGNLIDAVASIALVYLSFLWGSLASLLLLLGLLITFWNRAKAGMGKVSQQP